MAVNSMDYTGKNTVLDVVRTEAAEFFRLADDPKNWNVQTRCTEWEVRDIVGHMIDVTEGSLMRWEKARQGEAIGTAGLLVMADSLNKAAQSFRSLPREQALSRLKTAYNTMMDTFQKLTADEWGNFLVTHPYMGALPTLFYPAFHVMDYGVHTWDIRWGLGKKTGKLDERTAGVLVPYMLFALLPSTVKDGKFEAKPETGNFEGCDAVFSFDPSDFVLTAFQRFSGGTARGDPEVVKKVRNLFFRI